MMASLETKFVGKTFENPFMNASGVHCMSAEELDELAESAAGTFIMKSARLQRVKVIRHHAIKISHTAVLTQWGFQIMVWTSIWIMHLNIRQHTRKLHQFFAPSQVWEEKKA